MQHADAAAIVRVKSGAGGTESMDWAGMLERMFMRWGERRGYKVELIDQQDGDQAGVVSAEFIIRGERAYGMMAPEHGVHRLVRVSPFDSNNRRHTSFASVDVVPEVPPEEINIHIPDSDLRRDVFRSQGAGGQGVNTTDSAVQVDPPADRHRSGLAGDPFARSRTTRSPSRFSSSACTTSS